MKKTILSVVSILLTVLMIVMSCPLQAMAYFVTRTDETTVLSGETEKLDLSEVEILSEDVSKRGESQKHFKLSDGSFIAVQYSEPVHYADEEGKWIDIDNTLCYNKADIKNTDDFDGYVNTANSFKAKFADSVEDALFYIEGSNGENKLSFEFIDSDINSAEATINAEAAVELDKNASLFSRNQEMIACNTVSDEIAYDEIIDDVDFNYTVTARGIKENIIINKRLDSYNFAFSVEAAGLTLTKNSDGSITASDAENNVIYTIPAPFMYDKNGRFSDAVEYTLYAKANGKYTLRIVADKAWINNRETAFPVVIDPIVNTTDNIEENNPLIATYVTSAEADANKSNVPAMFVGKHTNGSINRAYIEMYIPTLSRNSVITSAQLCLYQVLQPSDTYMVELHEASDTWDKSTLTWNNQPGYEDTIIDCIDVSEGTNSSFKKWDITRQAIEYDGVDSTNGFVLKASDEDVSAYTQVLNGMVASALRPYIIVQYRSQMGIEEDFSYITYSDNNDGIAYVNNYTGNMVYVKNLVTSNSDVMPASLSLIYNSCMAHSRFSSSGLGSARLNTCVYDRMYLSNGWKFSAQQSIVPISIMDIKFDDSEVEYAYIYTDEDGTEHYFYRDMENTESVTYVDEDDLGMTLTYIESDNQYKIEYDGGATKLFKIIQENTFNGMSNNGYLISEADANGNTIIYGYDTTYPGRLISITDPSGTVIQLEYNSRDYVSKVKMGSIEVTLDYLIMETDSENSPNVPVLLTAVSNGTNTSYFSYNNEGYLVDNGLQRITNSDTSYLHFGYLSKYYDSTEEELFVDEVRWCSGGEAGVLAAYYEYEESYATTVHYIGVDCLNSETSTSKDDIYFTYTFDKNGNLTLAYSENYDRSLVYSTDTYGYSSLELNNPKTKLTSMAQVGIINENLLGDVNYFDSNTEFTYTSGVTMTNAPSYEYISARTRKVEFSNANDKLYLTKALDTGKYALSFYAKFEDEASYVLSAKNSSGTVLKATEGFSSATTVKDGEWSKTTLEFTLTSADAVTFELTAQSAGVIYLNGIMLGSSEEYMPATYNLLYNGGFENGLDAWTVSSGSNFAITTNSDVKFGDKAVAATGSVMSEYTVSTEYDVDSNPLYSYIISGWAKAESLNNINSRVAFELYAKVKYSYTNTENILVSAVKETKVPFSADTTEWQYVSGVVEMPSLEEGQTLLRVDSIEIGGRYANNANAIIFDNFALVCDTAITIDYDENGNMSEVSVDNEDLYTYEYDEYNNLIKIKDENGLQVSRYEYDSETKRLRYEYNSEDSLIKEYFYDSFNNLLRVEDADGNILEKYAYLNGKIINAEVEGVSYTYSYTSFGEPNSTSVTKSINGIRKTMYYGSMYHRCVWIGETDSLGNTSLLTLDENLQINKVTDARGFTTNYSYVGDKVSTKVADIRGSIGNIDDEDPWTNFVYDSLGRISDIYHEPSSCYLSTGYHYTYNTANRVQSVYIMGENQPLITYLYNDTFLINSGVVYANGLSIGYEFDSFGNIKKVYKNNIIAYEYVYDTNMQLVQETDHELGIVKQYGYNFEKGMCFVKTTCGNTTIVEYFDENVETNNIDHVIEINDNKITYSTPKGMLSDSKHYIVADFVELTNDFDEFGRVKSLYLKDSEGVPLITCTYDYVEKTVDGNLMTSNYISSMTYSGIAQASYVYTYDANGNILSISDGTYTTNYTYDEMNQLIREDNQKLGLTWVYEYNPAGNILAKKEYTYSTDILGLAADTKNYTYNNTKWGDQLSNYNGIAITYDLQGNPLNWTNGKSLTWSGNRLESLIYDTNTYIYEYNSDGIRNKKTVIDSFNYSTVYEYILDDNNRITALKTNDNIVVMYYYDQTGMPIGMRFADEYFIFVKNQQGDIVRVISEDGSLWVDYSYDAFGMPTIEYNNEIAFNSIVKNNIFAYHGYVFDSEIGMYNIDGRYYDAQVGRFISPNTSFQFDIWSPFTSYNLYVFSDNNFVKGSNLLYSSKNIDNFEYNMCSPQFGIHKDDLTIIYNVPVFDQGDHELCGKFCEVVSECLITREFISQVEADGRAIYLSEISSNLKPSNINLTLYSNLYNASCYLTINDIYNYINLYGPLYAEYFDYRTEGINGNSHMIMVIGVDLKKNLVYTYNPWGVIGCQTFEDFTRYYLDKNGKNYKSMGIYLAILMSINGVIIS